MFTRLTSEDAEHLMKISGPLVPIGADSPGADLMRCIGMAFEQPSLLLRGRLIRSARPLLAHLEADRNLLPYRYSFSIRQRGVKQTTGSCSGFTIDGDYCSLHADNGECYLRRSERDEHGVVKVVRKIDVRDKKIIATDNWGEIKISRRKIEFTLLDEVAKLVEFLESISDNELTVYSFDKAPTLTEILGEFDAGGGGRDWAIEEVCRGGENAKSKLFNALAKSRLAKRRLSIAHLLLLCFPDKATRSELRGRVEELKGKSRDALLTLLAAYEQEPI